MSWFVPLPAGAKPRELWFDDATGDWHLEVLDETTLNGAYFALRRRERELKDKLARHEGRYIQAADEARERQALFARIIEELILEDAGIAAHTGRAPSPKKVLYFEANRRLELAHPGWGYSEKSEERAARAALRKSGEPQIRR